MAISRLNGKQIRPGVLTNSHVAADAAIEESKLDVNWSAHYSEALETKKVVDFVQVVNKSVSGTEYNLSTNLVLVGTAPVTTSAGTTEGVITDAPYNKVIIRDTVTGEPIVDVATELEVFGRLVHDGVDFKVMFFTSNGVTETPFALDPNEIDFQYMERFNLRTVSELFAANEKFVAGSADITAFQNINQLAKDLYGAGYTLDRDGNGNLTVSIVEQISDETEARTLALQAIKDDLALQATAGKGANLIGVQDAGNHFVGGTVEAVLTEIKVALDGLETELASTEIGKGASKIGVHDVANKFTGSTVEEVLAELDGKIVSAANGGNTTQEEVDAARKSTALTGTEVIHTTLDERLEATDLVVKANQEEVVTARGADANLDARLDRIEQENATDEQALTDYKTATDLRLDNAEAEVEAARGTETSLDVRLDRALNENGTLKQGTKIHEHFRGRFQAVGGEAELLLTAFTSKKVLPAAFQVGDDSLEVYINGQLQEEGLNYQEDVAGNKIVFNVGDGTVLEPTDVVQIKFHINNAE